MNGLLANGFVNPALLGGLGLAAVPIIIHFLSRRRFKRIEWGATRFLLEAERENRRRVQFEQWLLLALRCLAMALLALLVSRPFVRPGLVATLLGQGQSQRILVLDDSASSGHRVGAEPELERLKHAATRLLSWLHQEAPRDAVTIYLTSQPSEPIVADQRLSEAALVDLRRRISEIRPADAPARPEEVVATIAARLAAPGAGDATLYLFADFQRSDWLGAAAPSGTTFDPLRALDAGGARRPIRAVLVASGQASRPNLAITDAALERPQTMAGVPAILHVTLTNFAARRMEGVTLATQVGGAPLPATPVEPLEAGQSRMLSTEVTFADEGYAEVELNAGGHDAFTLDDTRRLAVRVRAAVRVLLVNGEPAADPYEDEVFLLRSALAPPGVLSSGILTETIDPDEIDATDLGAYDLVLLCNVPPLDEPAVSALRAYASGGGGLIFFLGDRTGDVGEFNAAWWADGRGPLPLPLESLVEPTTPPAGVGLFRTIERGATAMFPATGDVLSEYVHFRRFYRPDELAVASAAAAAAPASTAPSGAAAVLARFSDAQQSAALVERGLGRGRVLLFTSTADLEWNDWARAVDGSYLVTLLEMVQYAARRDEFPGQLVAPQVARVRVRPEVFELSAVFKSPRYPDEPATMASLPTSAATPGQLAELVGPPLRRVGVWRVELTPRSGGPDVRPLCVNVDPRESDLTPASREELGAMLAGIPHEYVASADEFLAGDEETRRELWPALLALLVLTLMLEQALAWWFGNAGIRTAGVATAERAWRNGWFHPYHRPRAAEPQRKEAHVSAGERR